MRLYITIALLIVAAIVASIYLGKKDILKLPRVSNNALLITSSASNGGTMNFHSYGKAPEFTAESTWLNSKPLKLSDLKGKVVLIDFWTYSCINCIRSLPHITALYDKYKDKGLVIIGVHTPEFAFEKDTDNVKQAIARFGIHYPVVQDNDYIIWNAYNNRYWPAKYLINQAGEIVYEHFGEGDYDDTENAVRALLNLNMAQEQNNENLNKIGSPEMYFGLARQQNLTPGQRPSLMQKQYALNKDTGLNEFSLGGTWKFSSEYAELMSDEGEILLKFNSAKLYIVASSNKPAHLEITVDGKTQPEVNVKESKLYPLFDSKDYREHTIIIKIKQPPLAEFRAFTFTFG